ncbi:MAG: hypothetical protein IPI63_03965 [Methanothrix sp.]|jgi:hypothetical protein|uniref:hypothetical protein n=1 Tax=Methanothrix sp. TaxID=90426 RepID=UPI001BD3149C|nr:hypothetical protein [Methanothrix sp.]MBK7385912.1 hypothetical protein [Methanothrix sp.]HPW73366.1 hypothetical protein [Methanothrix sp.]
MRQAVIILVLLAAIAFSSCGSARGDYIKVRDVTMHLEGDRATFDLNYTLDTFARLYVLALGARQLEPDLISFLGGYKDVKLIKADESRASLQVNGAGKNLDNCYLFYSRPFGSKDKPLKRGVERLSVVYPGGKVDTFYNVNSTQNVFYEAD